MSALSVGQWSAELLPYGFDDVRLERGHGEAPSKWEALTTPRMIEQFVPTLQVGAPHPYWRKPQGIKRPEDDGKSRPESED
jgi:hypothetical protein